MSNDRKDRYNPEPANTPLEGEYHGFPRVYAGGIVSQPGSAMEIICQDRDEWKRRALAAEKRCGELRDALDRPCPGCGFGRPPPGLT
jgi:hypothetical protein